MTITFLNKHKRVKVLGNDFTVIAMFKNRGYRILLDGQQHNEEPDLICFTGGNDVDPKYYKQKDLFCGNLDRERDRREVAAYNAYIDTPKVGICRGGQLLNILSGGRMWQDVTGHGGTHKVRDLLFNQKEVLVTSTHHQMMIAGEGGELIAIVENTRSKSFRGDTKEEAPKFDTEVVYYEKTKSLCYQPHPEYVNNEHDCNEYFFSLVNYLL